MPYIGQPRRIDFDAIVSLIMSATDGDPFDGRLNYILFKLVKEHIKKYGESYATYQMIIGELENAKLEIWRRMIAKYEDKKIKDNGDVE